ncbi:MAG: D-tyrosyl-tRNA(Tyr) deacylase [Synergistaceae bacterium]|nr:D-tyrosyl-tRNA(Tyr) deacylase [Synergistaceae bacterium]MBR1603047.1 D-tyrosyl-tRNA(Tyr) deacylase [Synergistaceae bacterium]
MRLLIQRVKKASVSVDEKGAELSGDKLGELAEIGEGVCVLVGVGVNDTESEADKLADKLVNLRIFEDEDGKLNLSLLDIHGEALLISQFTLYANCKKGRRPSFIEAASAEKGRELYNYFVERVKNYNVEVKCGVYQSHMLVEIHNDGPTTIILDSEDLN